MFDITLENEHGKKLTFGQNSPFTILSIDGLSAPDATINTNQTALIDGAKFTSSKVNMRTLMIAFAIEYDTAKNRIEVFKVLKTSKYVKLTYRGQYREVFIEGYVETMPISYFDMVQAVTVTIVCPSPYFKDAQLIVNEFNNIVPAFHFPFASTEEPQLVFSYISNNVGISVENDGDVDCGMIIDLYARVAVSNPKIYNYITQEYIGININMQSADLIRIDTRQGHKTATLIRSGVESSVFNQVMSGSTWLQLPAEGATFVYEVGTGLEANLNVSFDHYNLYEGV